jgi:hypothetical protein
LLYIPLDAHIDIDKSWVQGTVESINILKMTKKLVGYEYYPNNPYDTPVEELITEIYLAVR